MGTSKENTIHLLTFDDIVLHKESLKLIEEVMGMYTEVRHDENKVVSSPIVHLYSKSDTMSLDGELNGFSDALFFETRIFDPKNRTYSVCENDSVDTPDAAINSIKIFKDGSTMIMFRGNHKFTNLTTLVAHRV